MKKSILVLSLAVTGLSALPAAAQFGGLMNRSGSEQAAAPDAKAFVDSFVMSYKQVLTAQTHFAEALGLKDQVDLLKAEQQALGSGTVDTDRLKKISEVSANAQRAIDERQKAQPELDAQSREAYGKGLVSLFDGLKTGREVVQNAQAVSSGLGRNPMGLVGTGRTAAYVVKEAPGYIRNLQESAKLALQFGRDNGVQAPANATALLDGL